MVKYSENLKCMRLKKQLIGRIISGSYAFGSRFPGLNELSKEYKISYATVCKTVKLLEREGFLRCQTGIGYFVCYSSGGTTAAKKEVNLISTAGYFKNYQDSFEKGIELFREAGWQVNLLFSDDLYDLTPAINSPDLFSIITAFNVNWERFAATFGQLTRRAVVLGRLSGNQEITSIVADECTSIKLCMEHFAAMGRKKVALAALLPDSGLAAIRIAAWRNAMLENGMDLPWIQRHLLHFDTGTDFDAISSQQKTKIITKWLTEDLTDADAVILPSPMSTFIDTARKLKVDIPGKLAVVAIGNKQKFLEKYPEVSVLDNNFYGHFQYALAILEERYSTGRTTPGSWYFCQPSKIISSTVSKQ